MDSVIEGIVESIDDDMKTISEIADDLDAGRNYVSGCLSVLRELGVLECNEVGPNKLYTLQNRSHLTRLQSGNLQKPLE